MNDQYSQDVDHLRLLSIFHYIIAGLLGLFSLFPLIHVAIGIAILTGAIDGEEQAPPPAFFGWMLVLIPAVFILTGLALAICVAVAGRRLAQHTGHTYCLVIAALECLFMPLGTVLGVLTLIVLTRPSVKTMFGLPPTYG